MFANDIKVCDMIDINFNLLQLLPRTGLELKYANLPIKEACRRCGIDRHTFILICNVYTFNDYIPSAETLEESSLEDIMKYLHNSHDSYTGIALKSLENALSALIMPCSEQQKEVVQKFFSDYEIELEKHFSYEEENLFPYVNSIISGCPDSNYSIAEYEKRHENVDEKLEDLKNIVMKYLPEVCDNNLRIDVLMSIYHLQDDLKRHTYVENNILVPIVSRMEENGKWTIRRK
jgi:hypothetical protein